MSGRRLRRAVRPEGAADTGGLFATVAKLGRSTGVTAFGALFPNRLESLGALEAYTSWKRFSHASPRSLRRSRSVPCPDWY
ncbi:hypothetical protein BM536_034455 [Streptomyces phaeoluteigriseus]|uniref:Uncharacterized protein n=1 Tax=Streptomyces phaeoluteigriseus TaxID=114686 RepID=A0A1V6MIJ5_9ACTN|nr:hypothetical protein BM536_034455 [Streptomyces phaeoluteigriseus]